MADSLRVERRGAIIVYPITEQDLDAVTGDIEIPSNSCIIAIRIIVPGSARRPNTPYVGFKVRIEDRADEIIVSDPEASMH